MCWWVKKCVFHWICNVYALSDVLWEVHRTCCLAWLGISLIVMRYAVRELMKHWVINCYEIIFLIKINFVTTYQCLRHEFWLKFGGTWVMLLKGQSSPVIGNRVPLKYDIAQDILPFWCKMNYAFKANLKNWNIIQHYWINAKLINDAEKTPLNSFDETNQ